MARDQMIYWKRRAETERDLAERASDLAARKAHQALARHYEERALTTVPREWQH